MDREYFEGLIRERYGKIIGFSEEAWKSFCKLRQPDKVWWHLKHFGTITNTECREIYGINHCPSAIKAIRQNPFIYGENHYYIEDVDNKAPNRWGQISPFVIYTLRQYT